jgi:hypothetical protein
MSAVEKAEDEAQRVAKIAERDRKRAEKEEAQRVAKIAKRDRKRAEKEGEEAQRVAKAAARKKGSSNDKIGNAWEEKYAEFESYDGMPERGTPLHNWQRNQLSNTHAGTNAKIQKEIEENEGSEWSERRVKLSDCVEQKNCAKISNAWEKKYAEFKRCVEMPEKGTPLYTWQQNQLSNGDGSLNAKIRKEKTENEEGTIWSEWRVKLANCVAQKRRE